MDTVARKKGVTSTKRIVLDCWSIVDRAMSQTVLPRSVLLLPLTGTHKLALVFCRLIHAYHSATAIQVFIQAAQPSATSSAGCENCRRRKHTVTGFEKILDLRIKPLEAAQSNLNAHMVLTSRHCQTPRFRVSKHVGAGVPLVRSMVPNSCRLVRIHGLFSCPRPKSLAFCMLFLMQ